MLFYWKFFLSIIKGGENVQKNIRTAQMFIFTIIFTLAIMGAASAADNSSNNLTAQASSTIVANDTTNSNNSAQVQADVQNQTGTDPQIEHNGVINPTIYPNIQAAVTAAQSGDTIWLENGATFTGITNTQITISKNLIFDVFGGGTATIDGSGTNWGFYINPGYTVSFNNIIFQNFVKNSFGAAIANEGVLSVTGCTFTGNSAPYSGAIGNIGTCTVTDCNFTGNSVTNNGGAIANDGTLTVTGSTFTSNTAGSNGGAIASDGTLNINQCTFIGNNAVNGGAISNLIIGSNRGTAQIHYSRIVDNTAVNGNAIYNSLGCFVNAEYNWWGSNNGASGSNYGVVDADPYIMLRLTASPTTINNGDTSTVIADLTRDNYNNPSPGTLPDGIPVTFTLTNGPYGSLATPLTRYTNAGQVSIIFTANDPNAPDTQNVRATVDNQQVTCDILINPTAKLVITKTADQANYNVGNNVEYTIIVGNNGPNTATNVVVTDTLPAGLTYVSSLGGTYNPVTRTITWNLGSLDQGVEFDLDFTASVDQGTQGQTIANTASTHNDQNPTDVIITTCKYSCK